MAFENPNGWETELTYRGPGFEHGATGATGAAGAAGASRIRFCVSATEVSWILMRFVS